MPLAELQVQECLVANQLVNVGTWLPAGGRQIMAGYLGWSVVMRSLVGPVVPSYNKRAPMAGW
ncbi:hypothetical protein [Sporolituus thermophilus]|uniref:hypothetical protein n=1 Tax=Sporolituus thermophilus TaxID=608505 RepID=UPI00115F8665|nr:hypothetical protein [Sporolituus thermophilus]